MTSVKTIATFLKGSASSKSLVLIFVLLLSNIIIWALTYFLLDDAILFGAAMLVYSLGLRHGFDADHIAAIDNVTRKLMQDGKQPLGVGFYFALGHSAVVVLVSILIVYAAKSLTPHLAQIQEYGGLISGLISSVFLFAIGLFNAFLLIDLYKHTRNRNGRENFKSNKRCINGHFFAKLCAPIFGRIVHSWQMFPLGFLFGLGFETATEVALLSTAALHAAQGAGMGLVLLLPILFTVGMLTVDTIDGVLMLKVYGWAYIDPDRKLRYNIALTFISTFIALSISSLGIFSLINEYSGLKGKWVEILNFFQEYSVALGYIIIIFFSLIWIALNISSKITHRKVI